MKLPINSKFAYAVLLYCVSQVLLLAMSARAIADSFELAIQPLLREYCISCHSTEKQEGELDLQRFSSMDVVKQHAGIWEQVLHQLELGEMPPQDARQLSVEDKQQLMHWVRQTLDQVALESAGDPGPVVLRRLSNHEYTYTLRDLTGVHELDPAREFPVDGAAGEGFTNVGSALVMSPALLSKYLEAAKQVTRHAVMLPGGIRFSASTSAQDWTDEALARIRNFYGQFTIRAEGSQVSLQGVGLDTGSGEGRLPLANYLSALQGQSSADGLSTKYLERLRQSLEANEVCSVLDPLRAKFRARELSSADIELWQKVLWKFELVGHIGRPGGPKNWQSPVNPLVQQQEFRVPLEGAQDQKLFLIAHSAGDGADGDQVVWDNPRLVVKDRPDLPVDSLPELQRFLESKRQAIIDGAESCLEALAAERAQLVNDQAPAETGIDVDAEQLAVWRDYFGFNSTQLEPLLATKIERLPDYAFIQGWTAGEDLSVLANSSDNSVRTPGTMAGHSVAVHPSPRRAVVIAWRSPVSGSLQIQGRVADAHPECGNGVDWVLEVRRGHAIQRLDAGVTPGGREIALGPFDNVTVDAGQVIALAIGPRDGDHVCDLTAVDLTLSDGQTTWDLAKEVSGNILASNPQGAWHFISQPVSQDGAKDLPEPMASWRQAPSAELAADVREHLQQDFPLTHPLLTSALRSFRPTAAAPPLAMQAPGVLELNIPAALAQGAQFVVTGRLASAIEGSVQLQVLTQQPAGATETAASLRADIPIVVGETSQARKRFEQSFDQFRSLFPISLCYSRIVPVDEVVTLWLFYREDDHLQRLILSEEQRHELDQLWEELYYISQAPVKQVDAFEQIYQFATQDRADLVVELEKMREPIQQAAVRFKGQQKSAESAQQQAILALAAQAWRRPLTEVEIESLLAFSPRLMLVRILTSPEFLYRGEQAHVETGPVSDWELSTRLSYFLWSSTPDQQLRELATAGTLRQPDVLAEQARRMLKDERVRRLATEFGCQYLHVRDVATLDEKSERHFPGFIDIRDDMQEEVARFFIDLFQYNRSALALLDADYSFVSKSLAEYYGLPLEGDDWQRVEGMQRLGRGGILGFAATLAKHSGASRSSAILRGMWLSEVVLGDKTPDPPKGVPVLPEEAPEGLTERQLVERHSSDPACAGCHRRIDPYGFALEGFDAIGRSRQADTKTVLYDGTEVAGLADLRDYLLKQRSKVFVKQFSRKLLGYALGRSVQLSDQPLIEAMVQSQGNHIDDLVELVVRSPQFREIRSSDR